MIRPTQQEFERAITQSPPLTDLQQHFNLSTFDLKLIVIALAPAAPLIHHGILHLIPEHNQPHAPFLAHFLSLDEQITRFILDIPGLDTLPSFNKVQSGSVPMQRVIPSPYTSL
jgi:hypothetical protein